MNIYYQGNPGSYMHSASIFIESNLNQKIDHIEGKPDFKEVWENIGQEGIGVLALENSYMGSIHPNLYGFLSHDFKIIGEYYMPINHCICSKETDIKNIKKAYSQMPALEQCHNYLKEKKIQSMNYSDTALSAKLASETEERGIAGICSELAASIYNLNILEKEIQDQKENTTRFAIIVPRKSSLSYNLKSSKTTILFEAHDVSASLYKCLGAFAKNDINLTKIESMPSFRGSFLKLFWIDAEGTTNDLDMQKALEELKSLTKELRILGEY